MDVGTNRPRSPSSCWAPSTTMNEAIVVITPAAQWGKKEPTRTPIALIRVTNTNASDGSTSIAIEQKPEVSELAYTAA
ncbi:type IV pilus biogenesis protein PilP [Microcella alkaliphila]|uniref:Type IV pilus biogenesis protein PilP n=1 Tax=Microcella alkaliphila TaxID=279828 RepID=A0A0U5BQU5_9MICO|nr:type IV pilus biogenesis protein PilP [Microcella alkaliphila]